MCRYSELVNMNGSDCGYGNYNIKAVSVFGLEASVYIQWLIYLDVKTDKKKSKVEDEFFKVDRKFIENSCDISPTKQREIDKIISKSGIVTLHKSNNDLVKFNGVEYIKIITSTDKDYVEEIKRVCNDKGLEKKTRSINIAENLKAVVDSNYLSEPVTYALYSWIDAIMETKALNKQSILNAIEFIKAYGNSNDDAIVEIINMATGSNYINLQWSYNQFLSFHKLSKIPSKEAVHGNTPNKSNENTALTSEGEI